jgi:hypothetical protein
MASLSISVTALSLYVGQTQQLVTSPVRGIRWRCTNCDVATVSTGGLVTAHAAGNGEIIALRGNVSVTITVNVVAVPVPAPPPVPPPPPPPPVDPDPPPVPPPPPPPEPEPPPVTPPPDEPPPPVEPPPDPPEDPPVPPTPTDPPPVDPGIINGANRRVLREPFGEVRGLVPDQHGRIFKQGEIPNFPQVLINGVAVTTQANVKTRWPDGSVQHAVMFVVISGIAASSTTTFTYQNQATGNTSGSVSTASLLADYDFDAVITLVRNAVTVSTSARDLVTAGHVEIIDAGSIATTFIIQDNSVAASGDLGWDAYTPLRPGFHVTVWPSLFAWSMRPVVEISKTTEQEDVPYDTCTITQGQTSPTTIFAAAGNKFNAANVFSQEITWRGIAAPRPLNIDVGLAYLVTTGLIPSFDATRVIPETTLASRYVSWQNAMKTFGQPGNWQPIMGNVGGRHDIGVAPGWVVWWLYSGDWRMAAMARGNAYLAGAWPMHYRETDFARARPFQREGAANAGGYVVSINSRPTLFLLQGITSTGTSAGDKITSVGTRTNTYQDARFPTDPTKLIAWGPECGHQPDPYGLLYLLTGEFYFLQQMRFWASFSAAYLSPANIYYGARGPEGWYGGLAAGGEPRTCAWPFRSRLLLATYEPDGTEEKTYFSTLTEDAIALWEGIANLPSPRSSHPAYVWGASFRTPRWIVPGGVPPTQHPWTAGPVLTFSTITATLCERQISPWQDHFMIMVLGLGDQLDLDCDLLLAYAAELITGAITDPGFNPFLVATYRYPYSKPAAIGGGFYTSWTDLKAAFTAATLLSAPTTFATQKTDTTHGYSNIAMASCAAAAHLPNGPAAWAWMLANGANNPLLDLDPKWALVPFDRS